MSLQDRFGAKTLFDTGSGQAVIYRLEALSERGIADISRLPYSIKVLLEAALRQCDGFEITEDDVIALARWQPQQAERSEMPFKPGRVIMQDFTGVPGVVDLAGLRDAMAGMGGDPAKVNPLIPVDLVIDHSVQVDNFGSSFALFFNAEREFERNRERYEFLKWGSKAFANFRVVPPATGIVHQVNLEYLAQVVVERGGEGGTQGGGDAGTQGVSASLRPPVSASHPPVVYPDSVVGTDSHTTMINGLGVVGWGVGGIEAEAVMLGQPIYMLTPDVVGFKLSGSLPHGATATDLVLTITQMLRKHGVVGKFVEFYGPGLSHLSLPDRATIANMAPEYGATIGFFPVDDETLRYLAGSGRSEEVVERVARYTQAQGLFRTDDSPDPVYTETLSLDMSTVEPSLAGPKRPQDRVRLADVKTNFRHALTAPQGPHGLGVNEANIHDRVPVEFDGARFDLKHGDVVIAAITSCTNTSNPSVMIGAGLLAKKAVGRGLSIKPWVKTSLAPGSKVVQRYLEAANLLPYLEALRFHIVGFGCTTCIGNSGPLPDAIHHAVRQGHLVAAAVLSGNRNFEGRVSPDCRANYLASPPLVVAYALAGTVDIDFEAEPLGHDPNGNPIFLRDIWPSPEEIQAEIRRSLRPEMYEQEYANVFDGNEAWNQVAVPEGDRFAWDATSTYIKEPPFFQNLTAAVPPVQPIAGARVLAYLSDSITTDHISPAGGIAPDSPAAHYLLAHGVPKHDWNQYGARRGNHEVMMRGTFANIRIRNRLVPGVEGGYTAYLGANGGQGEPMSIYDAAMKYGEQGVPLIILAGKEYGSGSSRDWAAKGPQLQGVRAVIAESYERIHRSNLVGMGILPLQFLPGETAPSLGLSGFEHYDILGLDDAMQPGQVYTVRAASADGSVLTFQARSRVDTPVEVEYYKNGGILQTVLRRMAKS
ncbi:MAG: aconitate hydratase AcnA [Caldilineales bacterium]|nr:aconitate hydratase AcnA [Caldilineales bacterium]